MRKIIKLISALVAVVLMVTTVSASGLNVVSSFEDLSMDDIGFSENVQDVDEMTGSALISTEVGDGYTINTYSVNWTVTAGNSITDTKQIYLATGDYIRVDLSFSPTPTGGVKIGGYNLSNGRFYYATKTSSTVSSNLRFSVSGAYLFEIENTSSFDIVVSGTYSIINFESSASLDVTHYVQEKTNWCWAACIQMCADYLGYYKTQTQIVTYVKGSDVDEGGGDEEYYKGMKYATNDVYIATRTLTVYSASEIKNIIAGNYPLIIGLESKASDDSWTGHGVVVTAVSTDNAYLRTNDPSKQDNVKLYKYSAITASDATTHKYYSTTKISLNS